jgi:hypothetical protein
MGNRIFSGIFRRLHLKETWVVFFMLGIIMMNFPFIHIFFSSRRIFGIPILFHYLTWGWLISIGVIYLFVKAIRVPNRKKERGKDAEH